MLKVFGECVVDPSRIISVSEKFDETSRKDDSNILLRFESGGEVLIMVSHISARSLIEHIGSIKGKTTSMPIAETGEMAFG
jgi:hypothetical protein